MADEFDELLGNVKPAKAKRSSGKRGSSKKLKTYPRTNPDDLSETVRVDRNDPRFDEWLTPSQARAQRTREKKGGSATGGKKPGGFLSDIGESVGNELKKDLKRKLSPTSKAGRREKAKLIKAAQDFVGGIGSKGVKAAAGVGVVGATALAIGATLKRAKVREKAYRLADAALERQIQAAKKAGKPMSSAERSRLQMELRRAYITQLENA